VARNRSPYLRDLGGDARRALKGRAVAKLGPYAGSAALAVVLAALARTRLQRVQVEGTSMAPSLAHGDRLVVIRALRPRVGDLVALHDPVEPTRLLVKRVVALVPGGVEVRGDNRATSRDSRTFGPVAPAGLVGRAVYRYFPPARAGFLRQSGSSSGTLVQDGPAPEGY
jgi:nickel-type superoxide dismutase maturation protease